MDENRDPADRAMPAGKGVYLLGCVLVKVAVKARAKDKTVDIGTFAKDLDVLEHDDKRRNLLVLALDLQIHISPFLGVFLQNGCICSLGHLRDIPGVT
ncbi:MAG: hypothetical protein KJO60_06140, partial [Desulfofustis sp.]|nr:hypothetical protein [Desulfofustis sp.]